MANLANIRQNGGIQLAPDSEIRPLPPPGGKLDTGKGGNNKTIICICSWGGKESSTDIPSIPPCHPALKCDDWLLLMWTRGTGLGAGGATPGAWDQEGRENTSALPKYAHTSKGILPHLTSPAALLTPKIPIPPPPPPHPPLAQ